MPCPFFPIPNQLIAQQTVLNLLVAYTIWKCKLFKRNLAKDSSLMLFVFFSFLFCPPPLYSLLCNANEQVLFVPKVSFYEFLFSFFFFPQESHPVAWFQLVLHLIQILAMPLDWKFSPSLNRNRLSCTLSLGPKFWNALRSPIRNWRRGEWLTNYPNSWNPKATVSRAWPER